MTDSLDFMEKAANLAKSEGRTAMLPVIEKELLHYGILQAMDKARLLEELTFQGGTCLRLCYSSERYSEDLDFAGGFDFCLEDMAALKNVLVRALSQSYGLKATVTESVKAFQDSPSEPGAEIKVATWKLKILVAPDRPDIPQQRISIEVAAVPAHTKSVESMSVHYPGLPSSFGNVIITCETLEEICADKLKAFVTARNIRYRDLWDLRWISAQPGFDRSPLLKLFKTKLDDYHAHSLFRENRNRILNIDEIIASEEFMAQMKRFLPEETINDTIARPLFREHMGKSINGLYRTVGAIE